MFDIFGRRKIRELEKANSEKISEIASLTDERGILLYKIAELEDRAQREKQHEGYNLLLSDYCDYCPEFCPETEKIKMGTIGNPYKTINNIMCENRVRCSRISKNMESLKGCGETNETL